MVCLHGQTGCTDAQALNFDPGALENDGSCTYPITNYQPVQIAELPSQINEASGAEFFGGQFWLHLDGGAGPVLHTIDTLTGAVLQTYPLPSIQNTDWEDLAEDATHLYIGDFGNNGGNRTDLRIYKISKNDLLAGTATAEVINFTFSDQSNFNNANQSHNFDCEAFVVLGDSLHIFSKRWLDFTTHRYTLPTTPGTFTAQLQDSLNVGFLTSAADISADGKVLLLGYDTLSVTSIWMLWDYPGTRFFDGNKREIILGNAINMSQAEGLAFSSPNTGFICTERLSILPQRLLRFDIGQWFEVPSSANPSTMMDGISVAPNPFDVSLVVDFQGVVFPGASVTLSSLDGQLLRSAPLRSGQNQLETTGLALGFYILTVKNGDQVWANKMVKQ